MKQHLLASRPLSDTHLLCHRANYQSNYHYFTPAVKQKRGRRIQRAHKCSVNLNEEKTTTLNFISGTKATQAYGAACTDRILRKEFWQFKGAAELKSWGGLTEFIVL